jgi:hypothetical protein
VAEEQYKNKVDGVVETSGQKKWPYCVFVLIGILLALFGQGLRKELSLSSSSRVCMCREIEEKSKKGGFFLATRTVVGAGLRLLLFNVALMSPGNSLWLVKF